MDLAPVSGETHREEDMLYLLSAFVLLLSAADHWTTYLCLTQEVPGWQAIEGNPIAAWLFEAVGLLPGLAIDSVVTLGALAFLLTTERLPLRLKRLFLVGVACATTYAVANNLNALSALGLSPFGPA
jgi:hypothetical protein